jgi:hypothetical protein
MTEYAARRPDDQSRGQQPGPDHVAAVHDLRRPCRPGPAV